MTQDYATRAVEEAEQLIAAGEPSRALDKLEIAAEYVPRSSDEGDASALIARIRDLVDVVASDSESHAPQVQAIGAVLASRESGGKAAASDEEPWFYGVAKLVAGLAIFMSVLSFILGIVVGVEASRYTGLDGSAHHHFGVLILCIVSGIFSALLWLGLAAALSLLVDNGRMLRAGRAEA